MAAALAQRLVEREQTDPLCVGTLADALLHVFVRAVDRFGIEAEAQTNALSMDTLRALDMLRPAFAALHDPVAESGSAPRPMPGGTGCTYR